MIDANLLSMFCCPICKSNLAENLSCTHCGEQYAKEGNVYNFRVRPETWGAERWSSFSRLLGNTEWGREVSQRITLGAYVKLLVDNRLREIDAYVTGLSGQGINVGQRYDIMYVPQGGRKDLHVATALREVSRASKEKIVLDLGCGTLRVSRELLAEGYKNIIALDVVSDVMEYGYEKLRGEDKGNITLVKADARFLPLKSASIDLVFSFELFEHIDVPRLFLMDVQRILSEQGIAIMNTWNALELRNRKIAKEKGTSYYANGFYYAFYTPKELRSMLQEFHFISSVRPHGFYLQRRILNALGNGSAKPLALIDSALSHIFPPQMFHCLLFRLQKKS